MKRCHWPGVAKNANTRYMSRRPLRLPMGMSGSADIFQSEMMDLIDTLEYVQAYIDDLLYITRGSLEDHLDKLEEVLKRLRDAGLKVNAAKSFSVHMKLNILVTC